ncbi:MAG: aldose 1-epimerase family protein [Sediminibacterium sp.]|uniref:aldose 1-epimerase family protein n=1 Tax=Sediminibacterium sp. TaxID=1917865 RepID=UPI0027222202|nr:aldose 1-epimerase family protein [Sediminibacterium sp.]MDO8997865.1 aldose 1-epimerase family protein [Sediminibacterium sp.]
MIYLENTELKIAISEKGAELQNVFNKETQLEYLWEGDPTFWGKKSPVLFPIVGTLKNNQFAHNNESFQLSRHGFARDKVFKVTATSNSQVTLTLDADAETLTQYPFLFRLTIVYEIHENKLSCTYQIVNIDVKPLYFSVGAHPAFKVPLEDEFDFSQYYLEFSHPETAGKWPITAEGLIDENPIPFFHSNNRINLSKELFYGDALVFKHLESSSIRLCNDQSKHGFIFSWAEFPYMGIWSAKDAPFVCIEPWCGIADSVLATGELREKEGMILLTPGQNTARTWSVELY